jgi:hypothetical protein
LRYIAVLLCISFIFIAGCAGTKSVSTPNQEYVEIDNPAYTMSPDAPPTIWVPRSYVESGVPRGSELVKKGYEAAKTGLLGSPAPQENQAAVAPAPMSVKAAPAVKNRIAVLEVGKNGLAAELDKDLKKTGSVILVEPSQIALLGRYASVATDPEKRAFAVRLQEDYGANLLVIVTAPDGISPGKSVKAELYYCLGGDLVKTFEDALPQYSEADRTAKEPAVAGAVEKLVRQINEEVSLLPWYGKVVAVEDGRIYINAGKEAGIRLGQMLKVYRGGKVVKGLGFAPGKTLGVVRIEGYVGTNGSFGNVTEGGGIQVSDLVSVE